MYLRTLAMYLNESRSYSPAYLCCFKFERSYSPISCSDKPVTTRLLLCNRSRVVTITYFHPYQRCLEDYSIDNLNSVDVDLVIVPLSGEWMVGIM